MSTLKDHLHVDSIDPGPVFETNILEVSCFVETKALVEGDRRRIVSLMHKKG